MLASDLTALSSFLPSKFNYDTGPFDNIPKETPAKPWLLKGDYNINNANKVTFRYNQLDSSSRRQPVRLVVARASAAQTGTTNFLTFAELELLDSREHQVGHRRVELGVRQP